VPDPHRYHQCVSADPTVHPQGTTLPVGTDLADADSVFSAVSALTRTPADALSQRGPARTLWLRSSRLFTTLSIAQIAREAGLNRRTIERMDPRQDAGTRLVSRVLGDPRFADLEVGLLTGSPRWVGYRSRRRQ
jgi:hypothetical protein